MFVFHAIFHDEAGFYDEDNDGNRSTTFLRGSDYDGLLEVTSARS